MLSMIQKTQKSWVSTPVVQGQQMLDGCSSSRRAPSALPLLILVDQLAQVPLQPVLPRVRLVWLRGLLRLLTA